MIANCIPLRQIMKLLLLLWSARLVRNCSHIVADVVYIEMFGINLELAEAFALGKSRVRSAQ